MFWDDEKAEREFYRRILASQPFKAVLGHDFNHGSDARLGKPMVARALQHMLGPNFDERLADRCLQAIGATCCRMVLKYSDIDTKTDIDTVSRNLEKSSNGCRKIERTGDTICDEVHNGGRCWCPIANAVDSGRAWCQMCRMCCTHARKSLFESVVGDSVSVELADSVWSTGANVCRFLIHLRQ